MGKQSEVIVDSDRLAKVELELYGGLTRVEK